VATDLSGGVVALTVDSFLNLKVKILKLVRVCRSYRKNKSGLLFWSRTQFL